MKKPPWLLKIIIPLITLMIGLIIGLGISQIQIKKEQKIAQEKMKEASKKIAFIQKKMADEKAEATLSIEQQCQNDLETLERERKALGDQLGKLKEQTRNLETKWKEQALDLETKIKQAEEVATRTQKELQDARQKQAQMSEQARALEAKIKQAEEVATRTQKELQDARQKQAQVSQLNEDLEREQEKIKAERRTLQAELEKTSRNLGRCELNNAKLCVIAEEVVKAYEDKGLGSVLLGKEPLTQVKKVELEQLTQAYREQIEQQRIRKK